MHKAVDASLRRLQTDYIDLYQIHRPDSDTPVEETLEALEELKAAGQIREAGCSNFTNEMIDDAESAATGPGRAGFVSVQNEYSLLIREAESNAIPACEKYGLAFLPYFPLASGLLTGQYDSMDEAPPGTRMAFWRPRSHFNLDAATRGKAVGLRAIAKNAGHTNLELAMSWLLSRPCVASVIAGATSADQVINNVQAAQWEIPDDVVDGVDRLAASWQ